MNGPRGRDIALVAGGAVVVAASIGVACLTPAPLDRWRLHQLLLGVIGLGWLLGITAATRAPPSRVRLGFVWAVALAARVAFLACEPNGDVYRYLWEGRVVLAGANPYVHAPNDPALAALRLHWHTRVNHPEWTAIYGPLALGAFGLVVTVGGANALAWKVAIIAVDLGALGTLAVLLHRSARPASWIVGYAWHPLVLAMVAGEGHIEPLMIVPLGLALVARRDGRMAAAGAALAAAVLVKATAVVWLPVLIARRGTPMAFAALALGLAVGYLPFADAGWDILGSAFRFGREMRFNDAVALIGLAPGPVARGVAFAMAAGIALAALGRAGGTPERHALWLLGLAILASPTVHPWYGVPLAFAASASGGTGWWVLTFTLIAAGETAAIERVTGAWAEPTWTRACTYAPVVVIGLVGWAARGRGPSEPQRRSAT